MDSGCQQADYCSFRRVVALSRQTLRMSLYAELYSLTNCSFFSVLFFYLKSTVWRKPALSGDMK